MKRKIFRVLTNQQNENEATQFPWRSQSESRSATKTSERQSIARKTIIVLVPQSRRSGDKALGNNSVLPGRLCEPAGGTTIPHIVKDILLGRYCFFRTQTFVYHS